MAKENPGNLSRRQFIQTSGMAVASMPFSSLSPQKPRGEQKEDSNDASFEFSFLTDIHLKPEINAPLGFQMAINKINELKAEFVLTGGNLVYDVMHGDYDRSEMLFDSIRK